VVHAGEADDERDGVTLPRFPIFSTARATPSPRSKATVSKRFLSRLQWFDPAILAVFA
jgi:hypothetical protein